MFKTQKSSKRVPGIIRVMSFPLYVLLFTAEMSQPACGISHSYCKIAYFSACSFFLKQKFSRIYTGQSFFLPHCNTVVLRSYSSVVL